VRKPPATYEVTLRRDVQQVTHVRVEAYSPQEAIDVATSVSDDAAWNDEERIGAHEPHVRKLGVLRPPAQAPRKPSR
jgi:hypothetical protein